MWDFIAAQLGVLPVGVPVQINNNLLKLFLSKIILEFKDHLICFFCVSDSGMRTKRASYRVS